MSGSPSRLPVLGSTSAVDGPFWYAYKATGWKKYRVTRHTHNPVDDARGHAEALRKFKELATGGGSVTGFRGQR